MNIVSLGVLSCNIFIVFWFCNLNKIHENNVVITKFSFFKDLKVLGKSILSTRCQKSINIQFKSCPTSKINIMQYIRPTRIIKQIN